jgi:GR25 family glycosyltransferase involved in LPS biosynthesis
MRLSECEVRYINLDTALSNRIAMERQFGMLGMEYTERISARVIAPPEVTKFDKHFVGCGQSHIDALQSSKAPVLILEDDAMVTEHYREEIDIPHGADAIYLGWSKANKKMTVTPFSEHLVKVTGLAAAHAILYLSQRFKDYAEDAIKRAIYREAVPLDVMLAYIQKDFNVYAVRKPYFIQSNARYSLNKWESLTSGELHET